MTSAGPPPNPTSYKVGAAICALLAVFWLAVFVVVAPPAVGVPVGLLGAAGFAALGWWCWRRVKPPQAENLRVTTEPGSVFRGDDVAVRLEILDTAAAADEIEVGIVCTETYAVHSTQGPSTTRDFPAHEEWHPADRSQRIQAFRLQLPADAPFTFHGSQLTYAWHVVAREPRPGRSDRRVSAPLEVQP